LIKCESLNNLDSQTRVRVLDLNYEILICMTNLSSNSINFPTCLPRLYGPPITEISTPWFRLFMYQVCGLGPKTIIYAKGKRVKKLPEILYDSKMVLIQNWKQEPNILPLKTALQTINDMLASSPIIVQLNQPLKAKLIETIKVSFPLQEVLNLKDENDEKEIMKISKEIIEKLYLEVSMGTIEFQKNIYDEDNIEYLPIKINFGLPLEDDEINKGILNSIVEKDLFSQTNVKKHSDNMKLLSGDFLNFIADNIDKKLTLGFEQNNYPTSNILFDGFKLKKI
jgi:hypothetical protein